LAKQLVYGLKRKNIRMIFIDEAGTLSLDAIRGMVLVRDVAQIQGWPLSLVFIGMDDLPTKMCAVPQIENRIHEWSYFAEYRLEELFEMLKELHPHFAGLDLNNPMDREQVEFIHQKFGGMPGLVVPFLNKLDRREGKFGTGSIDLRVLKAVYLRTQRDKDRAIASSKAGANRYKREFRLWRQNYKC
jgi:hypothetical protein